MFQKGNTYGKKGGKKGSRALIKRLGSDEAVTKHFRNLRRIRQEKREERIKELSKKSSK